jgi:hypothetical protein
VFRTIFWGATASLAPPSPLHTSRATQRPTNFEPKSVQGPTPTAAAATTDQRFAPPSAFAVLRLADLALRTAFVDDGLSVLQAGGGDARATLLASNVLVALATPSGAQLWACVTEATDGQPTTAGAMASAIERCCTTMAGALFASSLLS